MARFLFVTRVFTSKLAAKADHDAYVDEFSSDLYTDEDRKIEEELHPWGFSNAIGRWCSVSYYSTTYSDFADIMAEESRTANKDGLIGILNFNVFSPNMKID